MDCIDLRAILSGFIDGELDADRRHEAERHLVGCEACRARVSRAESIDLLLREAAARWGREAPLPEPVIERVLSRTVADLRTLRRMRRVALFGWLAAAAALGLAASVWLIDRSWRAPQDSMTSLRDGGQGPGELLPTDLGGVSPSGGGGGRGWTPGEGASGDGAPREWAAGDSSTILADGSGGRDALPRGISALPHEGLVALALHGPPAWLALALDPAHSDEPFSPDLAELRDGGMFAEEIQDHVDTLLAASQLLRQFHRMELSSATALDHLRDRIEYDRLLERLDAADALLGDLEAQGSIKVAGAMLLKMQQHRAIDREELREMKRDLCRFPLADRLEKLAELLEVRTQA